MQQVNVSSGFKRTIRRLQPPPLPSPTKAVDDLDESGDSIDGLLPYWEFRGDSSAWQPCKGSTSAMLESAWSENMPYIMLNRDRAMWVASLRGAVKFDPVVATAAPPTPVARIEVSLDAPITLESSSSDGMEKVRAIVYFP